MRRNQLLIALAFLVAIAAVAIVRTEVRAQTPSQGARASLPTEIPLGADVPAQNQTSVDEYSWNSFIALNQPAALDANGRPVRDDTFPNGKPDLTKPFDARGPRVWEGLKADHELFRHKGIPPVPWNEYDNDLPCR